MDIPTKAEIRKFIIDKRDTLDVEQKETWDKIIFKSIIGSGFYIKSSVIFTFVSFRSEVNTHRLINHALEEGKTVCVPKIKSKQKGIEVFKIDSLLELEPGYFGVPEPSDKCPGVDINDIDLILMPGLAFDREGRRLGYGGGFYDRFLTQMDRTVSKIAPAYNFQVLGKVPADPWDARIDGIVTNEEVINIDIL